MSSISWAARVTERDKEIQNANMVAKLQGGEAAFLFLGACAMTTKLLDCKICTFKILASWHFTRKTASLDDFPLCPHPPSKTQILFLLSSRRLFRRSFPPPEFWPIFS